MGCNSKRVLVITSDDYEFTKAARQLWDNHSLFLSRSPTPEESLDELARDVYSLVIIAAGPDSELPNRIESLRSRTAAPIAVMSDRHYDSRLKTDALYAGADRFLDLPLTHEQTQAEIYAMLRNSADDTGVSGDGILYTHGIRLDINRRSVFVDGVRVNLLKLEFDILSRLIASKKALTYEQLFESVWGFEYTYSSKQILWTQIARLRRKLKTKNNLPQYIKTVRGVGYIFDPE